MGLDAITVSPLGAGLVSHFVSGGCFGGPGGAWGEGLFWTLVGLRCRPGLVPAAAGISGKDSFPWQPLGCLVTGFSTFQGVTAVSACEFLISALG